MKVTLLVFVILGMTLISASNGSAAPKTYEEQTLSFAENFTPEQIEVILFFGRACLAGKKRK